MFKTSKIPYIIGALALLSSAGAAEAQVVDFTLDTVDIEVNDPSNTGGTGSLVLRFQDVATIGSTITDLLVESTSDYQSAISSGNGLSGGVGPFGQINLAGGTSTSFQFSLVEDGTTTPIDPTSFDSLLLSFVDLDGGANGSGTPLESVLIAETGNVTFGEDVVFQQTTEGGTFSSVAVGNIANPTSTTLDLAQSAAAFEVEIEGTSAVDLTLNTTGSTSGVSGERAFLFAGSIDFDPAATLTSDSVEAPFEMESAAGLTLLGLGAAMKLRKRK